MDRDGLTHRGYTRMLEANREAEAAESSLTCRMRASGWVLFQNGNDTSGLGGRQQSLVLLTRSKWANLITVASALRIEMEHSDLISMSP
jgi:hypothetical protein